MLGQFINFSGQRNLSAYFCRQVRIVAKGYAVILTPSGLDYYGSVLGSFPELRQFEDDQIERKLLMDSIHRLDVLIQQQQKIEKAIGPVNLERAYREYSTTGDYITLEQIVNEVKAETDQANDAIEKYKIQKKHFDKVITRYHKIVSQIAKTMAEMRLAGKIKNVTNYVGRLKAILASLEKNKKELDDIQTIMEALEQEEMKQSETIDTLEDSLFKLCKRYADAGTYNIKLRPERNKSGQITNYRVSVSQIAEVKNSKDTATARAISKYLNRVLKQIGANQDAAKKFNRKKYTSAKGGVKSISYQLEQAIAAINHDLESIGTKATSRSLGRKTMVDIINKLTPVLETAIQNNQTGEVTIAAALGGDDSSAIGSLVETTHSVKKIPSKEEIIEQTLDTDSEAIIELMHTGKLKRQVQVSVQLDEEILIKEGKIKTSQWHLETDEFGKELYKDYQLMPEDDKIDNLIKIGTKEQNYYIAFSDKFKNARQLSAIGLVGSAHLDSKQKINIDPSNLASSIDLLGSVNDNLVEALIFTILNMSSASILSNGENSANLENTIKAMALSFFQEFAFNLNNFIINMANSIAPDISKNNTLLAFNLSDGLFVKSSEVLIGLKKQLESLSLIEDIVTVQIKYDTIHRAYPLWDASLHRHPHNRDARWNWVANQVANNTSLAIVMNTQALMQIF